MRITLGFYLRLLPCLVLFFTALLTSYSNAEEEGEPPVKEESQFFTPTNKDLWPFPELPFKLKQYPFLFSEDGFNLDCRNQAVFQYEYKRSSVILKHLGVPIIEIANKMLKLQKKPGYDEGDIDVVANDAFEFFDGHIIYNWLQNGLPKEASLLVEKFKNAKDQLKVIQSKVDNTIDGFLEGNPQPNEQGAHGVVLFPYGTVTLARNFGLAEVRYLDLVAHFRKDISETIQNETVRNYFLALIVVLQEYMDVWMDRNIYSSASLQCDFASRESGQTENEEQQNEAADTAVEGEEVDENNDGKEVKKEGNEEVEEVEEKDENDDEYEEEERALFPPSITEGNAFITIEKTVPLLKGGKALDCSNLKEYQATQFALDKEFKKVGKDMVKEFNAIFQHLGENLLSQSVRSSLYKDPAVYLFHWSVKEWWEKVVPENADQLENELAPFFDNYNSIVFRIFIESVLTPDDTNALPLSQREGSKEHGLLIERNGSKFKASFVGAGTYFTNEKLKEIKDPKLREGLKIVFQLHEKALSKGIEAFFYKNLRVQCDPDV